MTAARHVIQRLCCTVLLCCFSGFACAETVWMLRGRVREAGTRRPLQGIRVAIQEKPEIQVLSDERGNFEMAIPEPGRFTAVIAGVRTEESGSAQFEVGSEKPVANVTLYYFEESLVLPDVVVTAPAEKTRIAQREMKSQEFRQVAGGQGDPLKALQTLPGMAVGRDSSSNPAIRGSRPEDNLVFVDHQPAGFLFHMGDMLSVFNADLVEDFTIYASAPPPDFDGVLGAVIDVKLREPRTDRWGGKINVSAYESDVLVEGPVRKNQSIYLAARRSYLDLILPHVMDFGGEVEVIQFPEFYDYQGKYLWQPSAKHRIAFTSNGAWDNLILEIKRDSEIAERDPDLAGRFSASNEYHQQGVILESYISPVVSNRLVLSHLFLTFDLGAANVGTGKLDSHGYYLFDNLKVKPFVSHTFDVGARVAHSRTRLDFDIKYDLPSEFDPDMDFTSASRKRLNEWLVGNTQMFYVKDRWQTSSRWALLGGGRYHMDDYLDERHAEGWAGTEFELTDRTLLTSGWGQYHQWPVPQEAVREFGNPAIRMQSGEHAVAGIRQKVGDSASVQLEGYQKRFNELAVKDPVVNYVNGGSGKAVGLELLLKKDRTYFWSGWLSVSQSHSKRRNEITGQEIVFAHDQPWILNAVGNYWIGPRTSIGLNWRYHTGEPVTPVVGTFVDDTGRIRPIYGAVGSERLPEYHRLDIRIMRQYILPNHKMSLYLDLVNAYVRRNVGGYSYSSDYSVKKRVYQLPFFPSLGVTFEF